MDEAIPDGETGRTGNGENEVSPNPVGEADSKGGGKEEALPRGEVDPTTTQSPVPDPRVETDRLMGEMEETRTRWLESHRRALLAENAGRVVPELVAGATVEELEHSVDVARRAFEAARAAALAEVASTLVPTGNPVRQGPNVEAMSPLEKIAHGLKRE